MKLAEALLLRGEMQSKLAKLRDRLTTAAICQEGDKPAEDPERLLSEASGLISDLYALVAQINRTNATAKLADGRTILEAIAERDRLRQLMALLTAAADAASGKDAEARYSYREIKWVPNLEVRKLHKQSDDVAGKLRSLNAALQEANWQISLHD